MAENKPPLQEQMDGWLNQMLMSTLGRVALIAMVPVSGFLISMVASHLGDDEDQFKKINDVLTRIEKRDELVVYRQLEVMRHLALVEKKLFGYSTLSLAGASADLGSPMPDPIPPPPLPTDPVIQPDSTPIPKRHR